MTKVRKAQISRISQGDVISNVEYVEYFTEESGTIEVSKVLFPYIVVLTQDCDLEWDYKFRWGKKKHTTQDKWLLSVLVAPMYNYEHVLQGNHLELLEMNMQRIDSDTRKDLIKQNKNPRFHYMDFPLEIPIVPQVIDFKHYFSVNVAYLKKHKKKNFICRIRELFREDVCNRFAAFLARIALP